MPGQMRTSRLNVEVLTERLDAHHRPHAAPARVERAAKQAARLVRALGPAEAMWVAENIAFEYGVWWGDGGVTVSLSDLQLIAFAAALRAHVEAVYPADGRKAKGKRGKRTKKGRRDANETLD